MNLGERMELSREWRDGTYSPSRSGGLPTIFQLPTRANAEAHAAATGRIETWGERAAFAALATAALAALLAF